MNRSELLAFLQQIGRRPNRSLSQNFLIDENIVKKILTLAELTASDQVLEIGPGAGALTSLLLKAGAHVYAVEKDPILAQHLHRLQTPDQRLHVFTADILDFDFPIPSHMKVIANLPYHITTPILEKLLSSDAELRFSSLTIMVQSEMADRMLAKHGSKAFSSLALFLQFHTCYVDSFRVPASCFYPRPNVDSTVIRMEVQRTHFPDEAFLFSLIRRAFQQRRKMISSSLKAMYPQERIQAALSNISVRIDARPEDLSLDQWMEFATALSVLPSI